MCSVTTQRASEGSPQAAGPSARVPGADSPPRRAALLEVFCNIPIDSPEKCVSPCSAMLCECAQHLTAICQQTSLVRSLVRACVCRKRRERLRSNRRFSPMSWHHAGLHWPCCQPSCWPPVFILVLRVCTQVLLRHRLDSRARCVVRVPATPSKRFGCLNGKAMQAHPPTAARCGSHGVGCLARRKRGAQMRRSAPCHILSVDPWASDDSPTSTGVGEDVSGSPLVSLSPPKTREAASSRPTATLCTTRCDLARAPGVRWSCPALMVHCASEHVLVAGGFSSEAPFKRAREQAFDASALLRMST